MMGRIVRTKKPRAYVLDNGGSYSDHCIEFVETCWPESLVIQCAKAINYEILLSAANFKWWEGTAQTLEQFASGAGWDYCPCTHKATVKNRAVRWGTSEYWVAPFLDGSLPLQFMASMAEAGNQFVQAALANEVDRDQKRMPSIDHKRLIK